MKVVPPFHFLTLHLDLTLANLSSRFYRGFLTQYHQPFRTCYLAVVSLQQRLEIVKEGLFGMLVKLGTNRRFRHGFSRLGYGQLTEKRILRRSPNITIMCTKPQLAHASCQSVTQKSFSLWACSPTNLSAVW